MKRFFFSMIIAFVAMVSASAQDALVATLQHGENGVSAFYGASALEKAHEAAQSGDVITLSAGTFNAITITKAVKIYGAGYEIDVENNRYRTAINGDLWLRIPSSESGFSMEGIYSNNWVYVQDTLSQATFSRCRFRRLDFSSYCQKSINCMIDRCRISDNLEPGDGAENMFVKNSVISGFGGAGDGTSILVDNCVIGGASYAKAQFRNCIIGIPSSQSASSFYNCAYGNRVYVYTSNLSNNYATNQVNRDLGLFANITDAGVTYKDEYDYILTPEAAEKYLGTDGTQIGIYGGTTPFTSVTTLPQIVSKKIASETSADGKLSVKITVAAQWNNECK